MRQRSKKLHRQQPRGFTLVELVFSIAFLTVISLGSTITFVYILGIYNKAQSLTRTQDAARQSMDSLVREIRLTDTVTSLTIPGHRNAYCLAKNDGSTSVFALRLNNAQKYQLVKYIMSCTSSLASIPANQPYQQLVGGDLWSDDAVVSLPANVPAFYIAPADSRCPMPSAVGCPTSVPIWTVRVTVFRGSHPNTGEEAGTAGASINDPFGAGTTLQTTVTTRD